LERTQSPTSKPESRSASPGETFQKQCLPATLTYKDNQKLLSHQQFKQLGGYYEKKKKKD
jgi:hypothetical protein